LKRSEKLRLRLITVADELAKMFGKPLQRRAEPARVLDVLVATKLSQNTTDKSSYKAFTRLKEEFGSWESVSEAGEAEIKECIKVCGLANTKARDIKRMLLEMRKKYGSLDLKFMKKLSNDEVYRELLAFNGIGTKTTSCVLVFALGRDVFPVDTHVHRTLNRLGVVKTNTPEKTFDQATQLLPEGRKYELHTNLIKFGRNICRAKNPLCSLCNFYEMCVYADKKKYRNESGKQMTENNFLILEEI
jgi:endonuclease-3